ncbi:MAG: extracellular solute-binding protein [Defluviitaleaceae bacterium]|nr:extracellular solute-binding protein [Defluviitaleaceae bacterium]
MKKLFLVSALLIATLVLAACGQDSAESGTAGGTTGGMGATAAAGAEAAGIPTDREHYTFRMHFNYAWFTPNPWGGDDLSAYWAEKFNITMVPTSPDANEMETLNLMIMADDLPDVIWMDRSPHNVEMSRLGLFVPIDDMVAMVDNNWYHDNILASTQAFYAVDGVNYTIPNWARQGIVGQPGQATGGNNAWMITTNIWEAVGSPELNTLEDLFDYMIAVRDAGLTNSAGVPVIPMLTNAGPNFGADFLNLALLRAHGGVPDGWWFSILEDGTHGFLPRSETWRTSLMELNRWHREGLFPTTNLTNSLDQFLEAVTTGRGALIFYDHSADDQNRFRAILRETDPGNSIEVVTSIYNGRTITMLPARGLSPDRIYHEHHATLGWNGSFITTSAEQPERIFEFLTWLLTPEGSAEMMYGPPGGIWDYLDADGIPVFNTLPVELTAEELISLGAWRWDIHGHANHVDRIKFAVNNSLPEEMRTWVETMQYEVFTPNLMITDEFAVIALSIEPGTDLHISRTFISDNMEAVLPQIIMAPTEDDALRLLDDALAFAEANNIAEIERVQNERYQYNLSVQGGTIFRAPGSP